MTPSQRDQVRAANTVAIVPRNPQRRELFERAERDRQLELRVSIAEAEYERWMVGLALRSAGQEAKHGK